MVAFFQESISYGKVLLLIETEEREYVKHTTLQQGISSLLEMIGYQIIDNARIIIVRTWHWFIVERECESIGPPG